MAPGPDPEDISVLLEATKNRQKLPRDFARGIQSVSRADPNSTERIFYDCGGPSAWLAYALTKKAAEHTGHVSGRGKRQRLIAHIEAQSVEGRHAIAKELTTALEDDRRRIERIIEVAQYNNRSRPGRQSSVESSLVDAADAARLDSLEPAGLSSTPPLDRLNVSTRELRLTVAASYFDIGHVFAHASISGCTQLFPSYLAGAVRRTTGPDNRASAAVSIALPDCTRTECIMRVEVKSSKIEYIARELFGAHLEAEDGSRHLYLPEGSVVIPEPRLVLRGCRIDALPLFFGTLVSNAIRASQACQKDIKEGRQHTGCVSMGIDRATESFAEIYTALRLKEGALLRETLFD
ncbi:unnamed protein product [Discula destructiva]